MEVEAVDADAVEEHLRDALMIEAGTRRRRRRTRRRKRRLKEGPHP